MDISLHLAVAIVRIKRGVRVTASYKDLLSLIIKTLSNEQSGRSGSRDVIHKRNLRPRIFSKKAHTSPSAQDVLTLPYKVLSIQNTNIDDLLRALKPLMKASNQAEGCSLISSLVNLVIDQLEVAVSVRVATLRLINGCMVASIEEEQGTTSYLSFKLMATKRIYEALLKAINQSMRRPTYLQGKVVEFCLSNIYRVMGILNANAAQSGMTVQKIIDLNCSIFSKSGDINVPYYKKLKSKKLVKILMLFNIQLIHAFSKTKNKVLLALLIVYDDPLMLQFFHSLGKNAES